MNRVTMSYMYLNILKLNLLRPCPEFEKYAAADLVVRNQQLISRVINFSEFVVRGDQ